MSLIALQTDRLRNLVELFAADIVQFLPFRPELLVDLDGRLSHLLMSLLAAADQGEVRSGSNALVAVGIHAHAKHDGFRLLLFRNLRHKRRLPGKSPISSSKERALVRSAELQLRAIGRRPGRAELELCVPTSEPP